MQKVATKVFIYASLCFGILGVVMMLTGIDPGDKGSAVELVIARAFMASIFVILTSFALSIAGKYLSSR